VGQADESDAALAVMSFFLALTTLVIELFHVSLRSHRTSLALPESFEPSHSDDEDESSLFSGDVLSIDPTSGGVIGAFV